MSSMSSFPQLHLFSEKSFVNFTTLWSWNNINLTWELQLFQTCDCSEMREDLKLKYFQFVVKKYKKSQGLWQSHSAKNDWYRNLFGRILGCEYLSFLALLWVPAPVSVLQILVRKQLSASNLITCVFNKKGSLPSDIWLLGAPLSPLCTSEGPPFCLIGTPPWVPFERPPLLRALVPMRTPPPLERWAWPLGGWPLGRWPLTLAGWPWAALGCSTISSLARSSRGPASAWEKYLFSSQTSKILVLVWRQTWFSWAAHPSLSWATGTKPGKVSWK